MTNDRTELGLGVLLGALFLGIAGDALLRVIPWGLSVGLWVAFLLAVGALLAKRQRLPLSGGGRWLAPVALAFAAAFAWRDSATLNGLNLLVLIAALALVAARSHDGRVRVAGVMEYAFSAFSSGVYAVVGLPLLAAADVRWSGLPRGKWLSGALAVARGLALALPLLLVFGGLLAAADAAFAGILASILRVSWEEILSHALLIGVWGWLAGGFLRQALWPPMARIGAISCPPALGLGGIEVGVILGLLNGLFLAFVAVQFRYFFGGASLLEASVDLSHAEYARRGFFELVIATALALPTLLVGDWLRKREGPAQERVFRGLAALLVALLFVVMVSAVQRMRLYQDEFGLTELRLYTTAFMAWLGVVFLWFAATVLRGRSDRFAFGALVAGCLAVAGLNALNPDDFIVRANAARTASSRPFDGVYVGTLSADAIPALVEVLPALQEKERQQVASLLVKKRSALQAADWRSWNWSRQQARQAIVEREADLLSIAGPPL